MKPLLEYASRSSLIVNTLSTLTGINSTRHSEVKQALQSRSIIPVMVILIGIRFRKLIRKVVDSLVGNAKKNGIAATSESQVSNAADSSGGNDSRQALLLPPVSNDGSFPKVIFQTWKSKVLIPFNYAQWSESFRRTNPEFEYFLWDDFDNRRFIKKYYPWFLPVYDAYPREIYRADAVRYFFLYQFGGLYADMDTECLRPVAPLFDSGDVWIGRMGTDSDFPHSIPNAIMASRPLQEFWLLAIHILVENAKTQNNPDSMVGKGPEAMTGPIVLKRTYDTYMSSGQSAVREMIQSIAMRLPDNLQPQPMASKVNLLEPDIFYPIDWSNIFHLRLSCEVVDDKLMLGERTKRWLFPRSFLITYWTHSWKAPAQMPMQP